MRIWPAIFTLILIAPNLRAGPLNAHWVSADAKWLVHVDLDAGLRSKVGQAALDWALANPDLKEAFTRAQATLGMKLPSDIHDVTLYGRSFGPDGVVIVHAELNRDKLMSLLQSTKNLKSSDLRGRTIYTWEEESPKDQVDASHTSAGALIDDSSVVLGRDKESIVAALDVIDGKQPALDSGSLLAQPAPPGTIGFIAAIDLESVANGPDRSPLFQKCREGLLAVGEHNEQAFMHAEVTAQSAESAQQLVGVLRGLQALAQLQNPQVGKDLALVRVTNDDKVVHVDWHAPGADVASLIGQLRPSTRPAVEGR
ncbi:MAG TPA: hypothetical protein VFW23_12590 [Tepidisphaeraceae bacterium]|nr:hypothetical protein [Tepidisphaeraceae bacterium]